MNGVDYPTIVGDKPAGAPGTLPSMVPILFELTILLSAFGAVLGMFALNRLPQHHHPCSRPIASGWRATTASSSPSRPTIQVRSGCDADLPRRGPRAHRPK